MTDEKDNKAVKKNGPIAVHTIHANGPTAKEVYHQCEQCGALMNAAEWYCGPICGKCVRKNHKKVTRRA